MKIGSMAIPILLAICLAALSACGDDGQSASTPTPTPSCEPTVEITINKGEGADYCIDERIQVCTEVSCPAYTFEIISSIIGDELPRVILSGWIQDKECHWFTVSEPEGVHRVRDETIEGTSDETWFAVSSCY
jgi:hypothetical protein